MDQKMARVDISLILTRKIGKIKKGKYTYIIYSKDFPKSAGNPSCVSAEVEETTGNRLALLCLAAALQRLRRPSLLTIHTDNRYLQNGYQSLPAWKENGWTGQEIRNCAMQISGSRWTSCSVVMQCDSK